MNTYLVLIRGINVGGKNKVLMSDLKKSLEKEGFSEVSTYIASGNVILKSRKTSQKIKGAIEGMLPKNFDLDSEFIKVLVLSIRDLQSIVNNKPKRFGDEPKKHHSDVVFLIDVNSKDAMSVFDPREGIDKVWPGKGVIYSQRLSRLRTKSRLSKIIGTKAYKSMTIRSWNTVVKLLELLQAAK